MKNMLAFRYFLGFCLTVVLCLAAMMGYAGHRAEQTFDTDIKNISTKYPMVHINNYQYHKGFFTSTNDFEVVLGCDSGGKDQQIRLKIENKIHHFPLSLHGIRSAQVETTVLPADEMTQKIAQKANLKALATAVTDVQFDGGYDSTVKVPSGNIKDDNGRGSFNWDEITYKINKQSKANPNYASELSVPKVELAAKDATNNVNIQLVNLTSQSDSEQAEQQSLPTKADSKNHIDKIVFKFNSTNDSKTNLLLDLANYEETSQIRSKDGLVNFNSHTKLNGDLNQVHIDSIEMDSDLTNLHYDSVNKLAEQFSKSFNQCQSSGTVASALMDTLKNTAGELAKHQPAFNFKMSISENGNKGSLEMGQQLAKLLGIFDVNQTSKIDMKQLLDGNHINIDIPKAWSESLKKWLNNNEKAQTASNYDSFEQSLVAKNYLKEQNGHYISKIELKQGDVYINGEKAQTPPSPTATPTEIDSNEFESDMPQDEFTDDNLTSDTLDDTGVDPATSE